MFNNKSNPDGGVGSQWHWRPLDRTAMMDEAVKTGTFHGLLIKCAKNKQEKQ